VTFSIVAYDASSYGVAVASKFLAVGAMVPGAAVDAGAIATQAAANLRYRTDGLALLAEGMPAGRVLQQLTERDPGRADRQAGVVDRTGASATYTGPGCQPWAGGLHGPGFAIQGNMLAGARVIDAMLHSFTAGDGPLARRLLEALKAGDKAGGDRRGRQSAALLVVSPGGGYGGTSDVEVDLRVDDHPAPVTELERLLELRDLYFARSDPAKLLPLEGPLAEEVARLLTAAGYQPASRAPADLDRALAHWAGRENLEERTTSPGRIDPVVLNLLRGGG
jgi:uncharacterized Ntn-hydrolase superfamily protein